MRSAIVTPSPSLARLSSGTSASANTSAGVDTVLMVAADAATDSWLGMTGCFVEDPSDGQALVVSVWVAPEARRRRQARRLIDAVVEWAREREIGRLRLWVTESNLNARRLYEGAGFTPSGGTQPLPSNPALTEIEMVRAVQCPSNSTANG